MNTIGILGFIDARNALRRDESAKGHGQREASLAGFLVFAVHFLGRLGHGGNRGVEVDAMARLDFVAGDCISGPRFHGAKRASFDAGDLHETGDGIAGHAQMMFEGRLGGVFHDARI